MAHIHNADPTCLAPHKDGGDVSAAECEHKPHPMRLQHLADKVAAVLLRGGGRGGGGRGRGGGGGGRRRGEVRGESGEPPHRRFGCHVLMHTTPTTKSHTLKLEGRYILIHF